MEKKGILTEAIQKEGKLSLRESMRVVWKLSISGILAQISEIAMQYIDAAMVGSLGGRQAPPLVYSLPAHGWWAVC